jgi:hypothetical protein
VPPALEHEIPPREEESVAGGPALDLFVLPPRLLKRLAPLSMRLNAFTVLLLLVVCVEMIPGARAAGAQNLGHKLPGLIGLDAGRVPQPGLYAIDRVVWYVADEVRDRNGNRVPVGDLGLLGLSNAFGLSYTLRRGSRSLTATVAAPLARLRLDVHDRPEASFDRFGLADVYIQPALVGWSGGQVDIVGSYGLYIPTGSSPLAGGNGVSTGHLTNQFSAGGTIFADRNRTYFVTALASYDLNLRKRRVDITRGDTLQVQGGAGASLFSGVVEAGLAFHGLWQVRDDRGADLPGVLRGSRDRVFGLGPDVAVFLESIQSQIRVRYEWDMGVRSRPRGNVFVAGLNVILQRPK